MLPYQHPGYLTWDEDAIYTDNEYVLSFSVLDGGFFSAAASKANIHHGEVRPVWVRHRRMLPRQCLSPPPWWHGARARAAKSKRAGDKAAAARLVQQAREIVVTEPESE